MRILLVNPAYPPTYWGFQYGLSLAGKRAALPPLGLITLAALLPREWELRLVDLNVRRLRDSQLRWADAVLVGGMRIQADSMHEVVARARALGRRTVVGGPAPTTAPEDFPDADVVFCGEAEGRIDELVREIETPVIDRRVLTRTESVPAMSEVPAPRFDLLEIGRYASMSVQSSRGCPFECEFCDIIEIFGRVPRVKAPTQLLAELEALQRLGYRGSVFFVDDNFIGNKPAVRRLLPRLADWQRARSFPFQLYTEASVNLAADEGLVTAMTAAGFSSVFLGIETPSPAALAAAGKEQNLRLDLRQSVERLTRAGLEVMGGFIVGFDQDDESTFDSQRTFISTSPIPLAMVGMLTALPGTALWRRLRHEGRLRRAASGDQFERPNFEPAMDESLLLRAYAELLRVLYSPREYFRRCEAFVDRAPRVPGARSLELRHMTTLARTVLRVGVLSAWRRHFWRLLGKSLLRAPHTIPWVVAHAIIGQHMIRYTREQILPAIESALAELVPPPAPRLAGQARPGPA